MNATPRASSQSNGSVPADVPGSGCGSRWGYRGHDQYATETKHRRDTERLHNRFSFLADAYQHYHGGDSSCLITQSAFAPARAFLIVASNDAYDSGADLRNDGGHPNFSFLVCARDDA
jgi:hypothetical protein